MPFVAKSKLPRLGREWYRGRVAVLWTHTFEHRATGWLNFAFHARFREIWLHACIRYDLLCPTYVLMPDHWHIVALGTAESSEQRLATAFLRQHLGPNLGSARLQDRAHDHVLREHERLRGAFENACHYVQQNPVRARLVADSRSWPYLGCIVPGYPRLTLDDDDFWDRFWKIHARLGNGD